MRSSRSLPKLTQHRWRGGAATHSMAPTAAADDQHEADDHRRHARRARTCSVWLDDPVNARLPATVMVALNEQSEPLDREQVGTGAVPLRDGDRTGEVARAVGGDRADRVTVEDTGASRSRRTRALGTPPRRRRRRWGSRRRSPPGAAGTRRCRHPGSRRRRRTAGTAGAAACHRYHRCRRYHPWRRQPAGRSTQAGADAGRLVEQEVAGDERVALELVAGELARRGRRCPGPRRPGSRG